MSVTTTDEKGRFLILLPSMEKILRVSLTAGGSSLGWARDLSLELEREEKVDGTVLELEPSGRIEGRVLSFSKEPVTGRIVAAYDGGRSLRWRLTDSSGGSSWMASVPDAMPSRCWGRDRSARVIDQAAGTVPTFSTSGWRSGPGRRPPGTSSSRRTRSASWRVVSRKGFPAAARCTTSSGPIASGVRPWCSRERRGSWTAASGSSTCSRGRTGSTSRGRASPVSTPGQKLPRSAESPWRPWSRTGRGSWSFRSAKVETLQVSGPSRGGGSPPPRFTRIPRFNWTSWTPPVLDASSSSVKVRVPEGIVRIGLGAEVSPEVWTEEIVVRAGSVTESATIELQAASPR